MKNKFKIKFIITSIIIIITCNGNYNCSSPSGPTYYSGSSCSDGGVSASSDLSYSYRDSFKIIRIPTGENKSKFFLKSDYDVNITKITVERNSAVVASINYSYPFLQCKANEEMLINEYPDVTPGSIWTFIFSGTGNNYGGSFRNVKSSINIY